MNIATSAREIYTTLVDYSIGLVGMIVLGKYDYVQFGIGENINNFVVEGSGSQEIDIILVQLNTALSSDGAVAELDKLGYRPASVAELLAFGKSHPEAQKNISIVALGSTYTLPSGERHVACLEGSHVWGGTRGLVEGEWGTVWHNALFRFAVVRK